jgi:hypothetical protein
MAGPEFDKASKKFSGRYFAVSSEWGLGNEVTAELILARRKLPARQTGHYFRGARN